MMGRKIVRDRTALAKALDAWAEARERAVTELSVKASAAASQGCKDDAAFYQFAVQTLKAKAIHERARAAALRDKA